jgi:hypothetical protein
MFLVIVLCFLHISCKSAVFTAYFLQQCRVSCIFLATVLCFLLKISCKSAAFSDVFFCSSAPCDSAVFPAYVSCNNAVFPDLRFMRCHTLLFLLASMIRLQLVVSFVNISATDKRLTVRNVLEIVLGIFHALLA